MTRVHVLTGLGTALLVVSVVAAQEPYRPTTSVQTTARIERASMVLGSVVTLQDGASYGKITDFVISPDGCIAYAVIGYEDSFVLVPWSVMVVDVQDRSVRVDVTRDRLRDLTFTRDRWPDIYSGAYAERLRTVFGNRASRMEDRGERNYERGSNDRVRNRGGIQPPADVGQTERIPAPGERPSQEGGRVRDRLPSAQPPPSDYRYPSDRRSPDQYPSDRLKNRNPGERPPAEHVPAPQDRPPRPPDQQPRPPQP